MRYGAVLAVWLAPAAAFGQPYAFVSSAAGDSVGVIDLSNDTFVGRFVVPGVPSASALTPDGTRLLLTRTDADALTLVDTATGSQGSLAVGSAPSGLAVDPSGQRAYVANTGDDSVSVVNLVASPPVVVATIPVGDAPVSVAAAGGRVYVANWGDGNVSVIDPVALAVVGSVAVGTSPDGLALDAAAHRLYVANFMDDTVSVVDTVTPSVIATVPVDARPRGLALDPVAGRLFVAGFESATVQVVDTAANQVVLQGASFGKNPVALFLDPAAGRLYVAHFDAGESIAVLDAATLAPLAAIEAPPGPSAIVGGALQAPPVFSHAPGAVSRIFGRPWGRRAPASRRAAAVGSSIASPAGDFEIFDGSFSPSSWEVFLEDNQSTTQETTGGNPGLWRRTLHFGPGQSGHRYTAQTYFPSKQGEISTIDVSWDRRLSVDTVAFESFVLVQGGVAYRTSEDTFGLPFWQNRAHAGLVAADFDNGGGGHPDFSASGGAITFGYYRRSDFNGTLAHGIDNFHVIVRNQVPAGRIAFQGTAGSGVEAHALTIAVERLGGTQGDVSVDLVIPLPDGSTDTQTLSWRDGDGSPSSVGLILPDLPAGSGCITLDLTLANATGGAFIRPTRSTMALFVCPDDMDAELAHLLLDIQAHLSGFSPPWLLALAAPAALVARRARRAARAPRGLAKR
jgi:YVTN family beta-propeller protein